MSIRVRLGLLAVALLVLFQLSYVSGATNLNFYCVTNGNTYPNPTDSQIANCFNSSINYVIIGLLVSFMMVALSYLIGEVINIASFKNWYRNELWETIKTVIIVIAIFSAVSVVGTLGTSQAYQIGPSCSGGSGTGLSGSGIASLYVEASSYLSNCAFWNADSAYGAALGVSVGSGLVKSMTLMTYFTIPFPPVPIPAPPPATGYVPVFGSFNIGTDLTPFSSDILQTSITKGPSFLKDYMGIFTFPLLLVVATINALIYPLGALCLGILLPLGVIFRALPFLRPIGASLIALSIAGAVIFPAVLVFFNIPLSVYMGSLSPGFTPPQSSCNAFGSVCSSMNSQGGSSVTQQYTGSTLGLDAAESNAYNWGSSAGGAVYFNSDFSPVLNLLLLYGVPSALQFLLLVIDLVIGIIAAQNLARLMGGSLRFGIGKMKLT
ncbi:MAG: hypothetical protein M1504_01035 [Candidatus Marsarchaeota archaeon]|nr:hypothetical protein [Candidatus Marsarchaeota archaeon]